MPRLLPVSDVRRALYWAAGGPASAGPGEASTALLGTLFHEIFASLTGDEERLGIVRPLERADASLDGWRHAARCHAYAWHVAPALAQRRAELADATPAVLAFWSAVERLAFWLAEVLWEQHQAGLALGAARAAVFRERERDVSASFSDPTWTDNVVVDGRLDAVLTQPATGLPCIVELKLGRAAPEADLCQAALYHVLLGEETGRRDARLALVAFTPERHELLLRAEDLGPAQARLKALIGRLAGVVGEAAALRPRPRPAEPGKKGRGVPRHEALGKKLFAAFEEFGVRLQPDGEPLIGPRFVRFFAEPERGVKVRHVEALASSVWMRLKTDQPPQIALQHGRIAIDVARPDPESVPWRGLRDALPTRERRGVSRFPVGVAVDGSLRFADLAEPQDAHFLVAGTTGSGKSEWLRAVLASLIAANTAETLRLVLIDPKRTAFGAFAGSRLLWRDVVYPADEDVTAVFAALIDEMEARYRALSEAGLSDLASFNASHAPLPRLVCVCDEYADLILRDRRERQTIEEQVARLGAKARAAGIHLVFATQRASREVVRGVIDTNLTARVALKVPKETDSRLILGHAGAATLLGKGDLLFKDLGEPQRLQSPLVEDDDLRGLL